MDVEWDAEKAAVNLRRHRIDFSDAAGIFAGFVVTTLDAREDYGEERWIATGMMGMREIVVVYTVRGTTYRFISVREATPHERETYWQERSGRQDR